MTPYTVSQRIKAHGEGQVTQAWWSERFAREERLSGPSHYLDPAKPGDANDGDAFLATFALMHGQEVLDLSESAESA